MTLKFFAGCALIFLCEAKIFAQDNVPPTTEVDAIELRDPLSIDKEWQAQSKLINLKLNAIRPPQTDIKKELDTEQNPLSYNFLYFIVESFKKDDFIER